MSFLYLKFEKIVSLTFINCVNMSSKYINYVGFILKNLRTVSLKFINYVIFILKI